MTMDPNPHPMMPEADPMMDPTADTPPGAPGGEAPVDLAMAVDTALEAAGAALANQDFGSAAELVAAAETLNDSVVVALGGTDPIDPGE
jgi:hypothetical protein